MRYFGKEFGHKFVFYSLKTLSLLKQILFTLFCTTYCVAVEKGLSNVRNSVHTIAFVSLCVCVRVFK